MASSHLTLVNAALGWPQAHYRVRSGPDGADLALLDILRHENVAQRFTHVAIGSGDHRFAEDATRLAALGVWVTVVQPAAQPVPAACGGRLRSHFPRYRGYRGRGRVRRVPAIALRR